MKRSFTLFLALLMLLASCGNAPEETQTDSSTPAQVEEQTETEAETELKDNLPEKNFGGADYTILSASEQWVHTYLAEDLTGDTVNDALYYRDKGHSNMSFSAPCEFCVFHKFTPKRS